MIAGPLGVLLALALVAQNEIPTVRPADLTARADLINQRIAVDARVERFDYQKDRGWNLLRFQGSPVVFRLPDRLAFKSPPSAKAARVQGVLRREGPVYAVDVETIELFASDLARLDAGVAALGPEDSRNRDAWARWAERRAAEYSDERLAARARAVAGEAIRIEADQPAAINLPDKQLDLARQAMERQVPDPVPASLVHRALRQLLPGLRDPAEAERLAALAVERLPAEARSPQDQAAPRAWQTEYARDPAGAYRRAEPAARAALNRRLLADIRKAALNLRVNANPDQALTLANRAESELPDEPDVARDLRRRGLESTDVTTLRLAEVQERARAYEAIGLPEQGRDLLRRWLEDQRRNRLSATDAEGRMILADQYDSLIGDSATAVALLREAWAIDRGSDALANAFRRRGYRLVQDAWVKSSGAASSPVSKAATGDVPPPTRLDRDPGVDPYRGMTRAEVVGRLGKPDRVSRTASQGQIREQWIYERGGTESPLHINFLSRPGQPRPLVISSFQVN